MLLPSYLLQKISKHSKKHGCTNTADRCKFTTRRIACRCRESLFLISKQQNCNERFASRVEKVVAMQDARREKVV